MLCATLCEALSVKLKENYLVLFMEDDSINRAALMLPAGLTLPVQSSLLPLPHREEQGEKVRRKKGEGGDKKEELQSKREWELCCLINSQVEAAFPPSCSGVADCLA